MERGSEEATTIQYSTREINFSVTVPSTLPKKEKFLIYIITRTKGAGIANIFLYQG